MTSVPAPLGDRAWLLSADSPRAAAALANRLRRQIPEALDVVAGFSSVVVVHDGRLAAAAVGGFVDQDDDAVAEGRRHRLTVVLDGPDVEEALERTGATASELGDLFSTATLEVAVVGFSPGFAYLTGLSGDVAALGRRATPRHRVPAGSLAIAAGLTAIYPQATPGGWWLLGRSNAVLFDAQRAEPALLRPGDEVEFEVVESLDLLAPGRSSRPPLQPSRGVPASLSVLAAPPQCVLIDQGRRAVAHLGVPPGGAADPERALLAALVSGGDSSIEVSAPGLELEVLDHVVVALIGLIGTVDGRAVPTGTPLALGPPQRLVITSVGHGSRGYVGVSGGALTSPVLGSTVTDALSTTGPGFLAPGDRLGGGRSTQSVRSSARLPSDPRPVSLRYLPGPHADVAAAFDGCSATLSPRSSKVGLRFEPIGGPIAYQLVTIESMPVVTGALQLPPDGCPVMLGPDHATLGGYPVIGVVISADLGRAGRLAPGDEVVFSAVSLEKAVEAAALRRAAVVRGLGRPGPTSVA